MPQGSTIPTRNTMLLNNAMPPTRRRRRRTTNVTTAMPWNATAAIRIAPVVSCLLVLFATNPTTTTTTTTTAPTTTETTHNALGRALASASVGFPVLVESWTPPPTIKTRTRTRFAIQTQRNKRLHAHRGWRKHEMRPPAMHPSAVAATETIPVPNHDANDGVVDVPPSSAAATEAEGSPTPAGVDHRISRLLDFVDHEILSSPLRVVEADAVLERIRSQHEADFRTAEASCLEVEDQQRVRIRQEQQRQQQQQQQSRQSHSPLSFDRIGFDGNPLRTRHRFFGTSTDEYLSSLTSSESGSESRSQSKSKRKSQSQSQSRSHVSQLAIRSTEPVLDESAVESIRAAARHIWSSPSETRTSRFTYQYAGNSEAHVFDFVLTDSESNVKNEGNENSSRSAGARAVAALNEALQEKIYPTIREAFFDSIENDDNAAQLFVYDSLVIRYNATAARQAAEAEAGSDGDGDGANASSRRFSAGQPLHRDLGLVSVNILLTPDSEFEGGGTFFEDQLSSEDTTIPEPLKPLGVGHCLAHPASFRHAGAGTTSGVREILVLFVSAVGTGSSNGTGRDPGNSVLLTAPPELRSLRLKECRDFCQECCGDSNNGGDLLSQCSVLLCRILHQRLAVRSSNSDGNSNNGNALSGNDVPLLRSAHDCHCDGEAVQYLGTALMEYGDFLLASNSNGASPPTASLRALEAARECFEIASLLTTCDSRVYNNLGIVLGKIRERSGNDDTDNNEDSNEAKSAEERAYRTGLVLLRRAMEAGCTTAQTDRHLATLSLNYGLFVANQNRFDEAAAILEPVAIGSAIGSGTSPADQARDDATRQNVVRLWKYCKSRCQGTGTAPASR